MRFLLFCLSIFLLNASALFAQSPGGITFEIEKLKAPDSLLAERDGAKLMQEIAPRLLVHSKVADQLVDLGAHPFFNGMYKAYAEHRPFELSPDMVWLLICQGFSQHVNNNSEELRHMFVHFEGKKTLTVSIDDDKSLDQLATWEEVIPRFMKKASKSTGRALFDNLTPAFSTTTSAEKYATQITALESMKSYFEFVVIYTGCGIPKVTLQGTPEDWQLLRRKAQTLKKYKLAWWIDELDPLLEQFIDASEGNVKKSFWVNMFKYHTQKAYGAQKIIDGWIVKFFPYNNKRQRNNLESIMTSDELPDERVTVDFQLVTPEPDGSTAAKPMQFIAGFTGLKQDHNTMCLTPQISWIVAPKSPLGAYASELEEQSKNAFGFRIRVSELPEELMNLRSIKNLQIEFLDSVKVPEAFSLAEIDELSIDGKISEEEKRKIAALFPDTKLSINGHGYNKDEDIWITTSYLSELPEQLKERNMWRRVHVTNIDSLVIPDSLPEMNIQRLQIDEYLSKDDERKLMSLFPRSEIYTGERSIQSLNYDEKLAKRKRRLADWQKLNTDK